MRGALRILFLALLVLPLAAAAGISKFDPERGVKAKDLKGYTRVAVEPLTDAVKGEYKDAEEEKVRRERIVNAGTLFAAHLAKRLEESGKFEAVGNAPVEGATLLIGGQITKFERGNAVARYSGVFGRSRFGAHVELKDAKTGKLLGHIDLEIASSVIPGAVNVIQSVSQFMEGGAIRVRDEILIARGDLKREQTGRSGRLREKYD